MTENVTMLFQSHFNRNRKLPSYKKYKCSVVESFDKILHLSNDCAGCPISSTIDSSIHGTKDYKDINFSDYRCILMSYINHKKIDKDALGDRLADYVDRGGNVVLCMMSNVSNDNMNSYPTGRFTSYHPFILHEYTRLASKDTVDMCLNNHPIMRNVKTLGQKHHAFTIKGDIQKGRRVDIEVVGKWKMDGGNMIGIRYDKRGLIVSIGCICDNQYMIGDIYQLLKNAVRYRKYGGRKSPGLSS